MTTTSCTTVVVLAAPAAASAAGGLSARAPVAKASKDAPAMSALRASIFTERRFDLESIYIPSF